MSKSDIPYALNENNIEKVVKIQVFRRVDEETIDTESLEKYVGTLEGFSFDPDQIVVKLRGLNTVQISRHKHRVEVYI
jgi:hypothetical protein